MMIAKTHLHWPLGAFYALVWLALLSGINVNAQAEPIVVKGSRFFYQNGTEFQVRGVNYEHPDLDDPLTDDVACARDVRYLKDLNLNVVQVDYVQPSTEHLKCMQTFKDAGIYVIASFYAASHYLAEFDPIWDTALYHHFTAAIDFLAQWDNSLAFAMGFDSFMIDQDLTAFYISYVKRITKDLKDYIKEKKYRDIPIGYRFGAFDPERDDPRDNRRLDYLSCGDEGTHVDFLALELEDCPHESDINHIVELYADSAMPVWVERLGCGDNTDESDPLDYSDVELLYSEDVAKVLVGGVVYQFKHGTGNNLVNETSSDLVKLPAYTTLSSIMATITPPTLNAASYTPRTSTTTCPTSAAAWPVPTSILPPTPRNATTLCQCMMSTVTCLGKRSILEPEITGELDVIFNPICSTERSKCPGIRVSPYEGVYGAFSVCDVVERYSWAASWLVKKEGRVCEDDFGGNATSQVPSTTLSDECKVLLEHVGEDGTRPTDAPLVASPSSVVGENGKGGLSKGAIGGIAGGVAALTIFVLIVLALLFIRRRKQRHTSKEEGEEASYRPVEMPAEDRFEAPDYVPEAPPEKRLCAQELSVENTPVEMDATEVKWEGEREEREGADQKYGAEGDGGVRKEKVDGDGRGDGIGIKSDKKRSYEEGDDRGGGPPGRAL